MRTERPLRSKMNDHSGSATVDCVGAGAYQFGLFEYPGWIVGNRDDEMVAEVAPNESI